MTSRRACPVCGRPSPDTSDPLYPFCSARCRTIDLGNWLSDRYRISEEVSESEGADEETDEEQR